MLIFMATIACEAKPMEKKQVIQMLGRRRPAALIRIATTRTVPQASLKHCGRARGDVQW